MENTPINSKHSSEGKKTIILAIILSGIIVLLAILIWLFINNEKPQTPPIQTSTQSSSPKISTGAAKQSYPIKVYFSKHPPSDDDPGKVYPVKRISPDSGVAKFSLSQLIAGPTSSETAAGYFSEIKLNGESNCAGEDFTINIASGKATIQFCRTFVATGVLADARAEAEINATLKQFSTVSKVVVLNKEGKCLFDLSGQNRCKM